MSGWDALSPAQRAVSRAYVDARSAERAHLVVALSGSHAFGFASPDSDVDLKAVHVAPTRALVGLDRADGTANQLITIDGVEVDYTSNEVGVFLGGVLNGNGNYLERVFGPMPLVEDPCVEALRPLLRAGFSRRVARHYGGFATSQRKLMESSGAPTAKRALYVLRTLLTGATLLREGEVVTDVEALFAAHGFDEAGELIARKRSGERAAFDASELPRWGALMDRAKAVLESAERESPLPESPAKDAVEAIDAWLIALRRERW